MATNVLLFTKDRMLTKSDGINVHSVRFSFDGPRYLSFSRDIRFDEDDVFNNNDLISVTINGTTVFTGWLLDNDPQLNTNESIGYRAVGPRGKLSKITHTRNGSGHVIYNGEDTTEVTTSGWTYAQIFTDIINRVPNNIIAKVDQVSIDAMSAVAPETSFIAMSVDDCLRFIVEKAGTFGFYITPFREIKVVDLDNTTSKSVNLGQIGQKLSDHSEYDVMNADLNWSVSGTKTKCIIEGGRERIERFINLTPDWNTSLEKYWSVSSYIINTSGINLPAGNYNEVYRKYKFSDQFKVQSMLISENRRAFTEWKRDDGSWFPYQASIDLVNREVIFPTPIYKTRIKNIGTTSQSTTRTRAEVRMKCVIEGDRLKVVVGPEGTAFTNRNITDEIYITDDSLIKENVSRPGTNTARNDTDKMTTLANQLLEGIKDEQVTGNIILDGLNLTWGLENNVDIENAKDDKWTNLNAIVLSITLNPERENTQIQISTNKYLGAGPDYAELKRRLLVGQKIRQLEEKVEKLNIRAPSIVGESTNLGEIQSSGDAAEAQSIGTSDSDTNIKNVVQQAMNEGFFTIQQHDHTSGAQGGSAFAKRGAALL